MQHLSVVCFAQSDHHADSAVGELLVVHTFGQDRDLRQIWRMRACANVRAASYINQLHVRGVFARVYVCETTSKHFPILR